MSGMSGMPAMPSLQEAAPVLAIVGVVLGAVACGVAFYLLAQSVSNAKAPEPSPQLAFKQGNNGVGTPCSEFCRSDYWGGWQTATGQKPAGWKGATSSMAAPLLSQEPGGGLCLCERDDSQTWQKTQ